MNCATQHQQKTFTIGMLCNGHGTTRQVKIEISQRGDEYYLRAVDSSNLAPLYGYATLTAEEYGQLPNGKDDVLNALVRLEKCGWVPVYLDEWTKLIRENIPSRHVLARTAIHQAHTAIGELVNQLNSADSRELAACLDRGIKVHYEIIALWEKILEGPDSAI